MDGSQKLSTQGKKLVRLACELSEEELQDFILYLKTRQAMRKANGNKYKPLSLEQWFRAPYADRHMLFRAATQIKSPYLARFIKSWFALKPWQKIYLFVLAMYYFYAERVRIFFHQPSGNAINK